MADGEEPRKHITEALGGQHIAPLTNEERVEHERVRNLIQAVASCYNSLVSRETDENRRAELTVQRDVQDGEFRRVSSMTAEERREVLRTYPDLLKRLRAEIDG